jgi:signal peptidase II
MRESAGRQRMSQSRQAISVRYPATQVSGFGGFLRLFTMVCLPVLVLDQLTKYYIRSHLALYQSIPVIPGWFDITFTLNPGAAFSMFVNAPAWFRSAFLFALSGIAIAVLTILLIRDSELTLTNFALALILAGAAGNLIDRIRFGRVVDFIDWHYYGHHYPIFNMADSAISIGVVLIIASSIFAPRS